MGPARAVGGLGLAFLLAGCSPSRVENGVFRSPKGYQVGVPADGWKIEPDAKADLELARTVSSGAMLVDATCDEVEMSRPLTVLARHLTFGLTDRTTVESDTWTVDGRPAAHRVIRGRRHGVDVTVEAVVLKGARCVHDFLYVAPPGEFENGRRDFRQFVESFEGDR